MANYLVSPGKMKLGFLGLTAHVDLAFDKKYSMRSDSIVALLSHEIQHGQTLLNVSQLELTDHAVKLLEDGSLEEFRATYGSGFIAGYTSGCSFDLKIERAYEEKSQRDSLKYDLQVDFAGILDVDNNMKKGDSMSKNKTTDKFEVIYKGQRQEITLPSLDVRSRV